MTKQILSLAMTLMLAACTVNSTKEGTSGDPIDVGSPSEPAATEHCVQGGCAQTCPAGVTSCHADCSGGHCTQTCPAGATCTFDCSGASCQQSCSGGSCTLTCSGGGCHQACSGGSCSKTCSGASCT